jgi:hypothetical protein
MDQILHIFKKDIRRHWPEILLSLALLALYTNRALHPWTNSLDSYPFSRSFYFFVVTGEYIALVLVIFWLFLAIRVVQGESLVGDRQWWTTKPYIWWQLLLAKLLFVLVFICVPLFHVQLFLLHYFKFPILRNLLPVFSMQLSLLLLLICFCVLLASLTKNLVQVLLVVGVTAFVAIAAAMWSSGTHNRSSVMEATPPFVDYLGDLLIWGGLAGGVAWQFARRRRWITIGALIVLIGFVAAISTAFTSSKVAERRYTRVDRSAAPLNISVKPIEPSNVNKDFSSETSPEVQLTIPVTVSGVAEGSVIQLNAVNIHAESPEKSKRSWGWLYESQVFWPEDQEKALNYSIDRKEYQKIKDTLLQLHVDLAISEYQLVDARTLPIVSQRFSDQALGDCRISSLDNSRLHCLYPTRIPEYVIRFDPQQSGCLDDDSEERGQSDTVSYAWKSPGAMGFPDPELSPISDYDPWFQPVSLTSSRNETTKRRAVRLCPGTFLALSRPVLRRQLHIRLDSFNARLEDLAVTPLRFSFR